MRKQDLTQIAATTFLEKKWPVHLPDEFILTVNGKNSAKFCLCASIRGKVFTVSTLKVRGLTTIIGEVKKGKCATITYGGKPVWKIKPLE